MRTDRAVPRLALAIVLALLAGNFALSWRHYDTAPSLAGFDEVMINDAAVGIARYGELRAPSLEGTPLGSIYALFPPGYLLIQGAMFRAFGLTPLSLRFFSAVPHMLLCVLGLLIVRELWRRNVFSAAAAMAAALLWLSDFASFWIGRQARMESLEELFGLAGAWAVLTRPEERRSWWVASVFTGLAFCMHVSAILLWLPLLAGLWLGRKELGPRTIAGCAALPLLMLGALWAGVHGGRSLEAVSIFHTLNSYRSDVGFEWERWTAFAGALRAAGTLDRSALAWLKPIGGLSYVVVVAGWVLIATRVREARTNRWVGFALACALAHVVCAGFVTGMLAQRMVLYCPFALLAGGIALSRAGLRGQRAALAVAALIALVQFATMLSYSNLPGDRAANRFAALPLPPGVKTVAGTTELWYYFVSRDLPFRIISFQRPMFADYWKLHPEHLDEFDAVILPADDEMLTWPQLARRPRRYFSDYTGTLAICLKQSAVYPAK